MIQHQNAAKRHGESGDEQAMVTARACARNRRRCVAAKAVRNEPFAREQYDRFGFVCLSPRHSVEEDFFLLNCFHFRTAFRMTVQRPEIRQRLDSSTGGAAQPPYSLDSEDHIISHICSAGGASNGSAKEPGSM